MDDSKKYIKMSEKAEEIQELLKDKFDWQRQGYCTKHKCLISEGPDGIAECPIFTNMHKKVFGKKLDELWEKEDCEMKLNNWIGLPTQDQLQDMMDIKAPRKLLLRFHRFTHPADGITIINADQLGILQKRTSYLESLKSYEQLWLAFVKHEKHNKMWDDTKGEWINEN